MKLNILAYEENDRNSKHCAYYPNTGHLIVNGHRATHRGIKVVDMSDAQKRKFETLLMLQFTDRRNQKPLKIVFR